jgi:SNF2 family DNA or RNA helicase
MILMADVILIISVDLTVANHVHLIEPHWNPMAEAQAVDRVHRIGQVRDVIIRRYIVRNSIETVRYHRPPHGLQ